MPIDTSGLTTAFRRLGNQFEHKDPVYRAIIVSDDGENDWTVDFLNPDWSVQARRSVKGAGNYWPGLQVRISRERKIWGNDYWAIMGADMTAYLVEAPEPTLPLHGWMHGFYQPDETTNLSTFQIYSLRVQPADPADLTVDINEGIYYAGGAFRYLAAVANENLAAYVAALAVGERQYLVISIDSAGAINVTEGVAAFGVLDAGDIPDPPVDERALCAVEIRNGDTALERARMYADLRFLPGGLAMTVSNTTRIVVGDSPYTILVTDEVIFCDTDGGAITADLPAGVEGTHYKLINCGASGNDLTVDPNGTEQLYGAGAGVASTLADGEVIDIHYNATEGWW